MAIKKVQIIPPGYTDILHPETDSDIVKYDNSTSAIPATNVKGAIDALVGIKTATITTTWTGTSAPYTQTIAVPGIAIAFEPFICPVYDASLATAILQKEAWNAVGKITTGMGSITVTCFEEKPTTAIPIQIKGV